MPAARAWRVGRCEKLLRRGRLCPPARPERAGSLETNSFDMMIDTRRTVEIEASPVRLLGLAALGIIMTAASAMAALRLVPNVPPGSFVEFAGYVGTVFFAACTALAVWRLFTSHGPVVTIAPEGIRDVRVAAELVPWNAVHDIKVWESNGQRTMVLAVDPAVEAGLTLTRMARWTRGANRALGADGLCVIAHGLKIGFDELLATSLAYARAWHAGAADARAADAREDGDARVGSVTGGAGLRAPDPRERWGR